tara:strand:- start:222 stop:353 length:132 start_codon:yes stop_codon:yes gene_type:complete
MSGNLSVKDEYIPVWSCFSQMIVGPAVTQSKLKEWSWHVFNTP